MAEQCKDLEAAVKRLEAAISKQNQCCEQNRKDINDLKSRVGKLENGSNKLGKDGKVDLTSIYQRLSKLEKNQEVFKIGIIETLKNFADIENTNREFMQAFQALHDMVIPLVEFIGTMFDLFGGKKIK